MYCPKCAGQNGDDAKFCRVCGSDLSFIAQAMSGRLSTQTQTGQTTGQIAPFTIDPQRLPSFQKAISNGFIGLGFLAISLVLLFTGEEWGIWMLIPAFAMIGKGVASLVSLKLAESESYRPATPVVGTPRPQSHRTGELVPPPVQSQFPLPPPSITEGTTKIIDPAARNASESR
jgi:hypothetical protein